ncbi:MAG: hypothetical protein F4220_17940 [Gammaproteobacteria bacterium]|nr:hypothetical protein [Gammaproteobacteria bacterium]
MFGSTDTATPLGQRPLRHRVAAGLAVLAFALAQVLAGAHVHAAAGSDEPSETLCAACAFTDDGQVSGPLAAKATNQPDSCLTLPQAAGALFEQPSSPIQPRAPPFTS